MAKELVLVVEDDDALRPMIETALRDLLGLNTVGSADGERALRLAFELQPALLLLDIALPGRDGVEIAWQIKQRPATAGVRILVLTGLDNARYRAMEMGCDDYLQKPFDLDQLLDKVRRQLGLSVGEQLAA